MHCIVALKHAILPNIIKKYASILIDQNTFFSGRHFMIDGTKMRGKKSSDTKGDSENERKLETYIHYCIPHHNHKHLAGGMCTNWI